MKKSHELEQVAADMKNFYHVRVTSDVSPRITRPVEQNRV